MDGSAGSVGDAGFETAADSALPGGQGDSDVPFTDGVSTLAGWSAFGYVDGPRRVARFWNPVGVAYRDGTVYVADFDNGKIRFIGADSHLTSSIDLGPDFRRPFGLAFANGETLYVSTDNNPDGANSDMTGTVWRLNLPAKTTQIVASDIGRPRGIAVLPDGRIAATDYLHHVVEVIDPETGLATVIAGAWDEPGMIDGYGLDARFDHPCGIAVIGGDTLVVADQGNNRIRSVSLDGTTSTFAGSGERGYADGPLNAAEFSGPLGVTVVTSGAVFITDLGNYRVRRIFDGVVSTVSGNGKAGYADDDDLLAAQFYGLEGLSARPDGTMLYVADGNRGADLEFNRIRQVRLR